MTFGGKQGFTRKPSTIWTNDRGEFAGIVHQERNWTFALFDGAGHLVPQNQPENVSRNEIEPETLGLTGFPGVRLCPRVHFRQQPDWFL